MKKGGETLGLGKLSELISLVRLIWKVDKLLSTLTLWQNAIFNIYLIFLTAELLKFYSVFYKTSIKMCILSKLLEL